VLRLIGGEPSLPVELDRMEAPCYSSLMASPTGDRTRECAPRPGGNCCGCGAGADIFLIEWDQATLVPAVFGYGAASVPGNSWDNFNFTQFNVVVAAAVSEPDSLVPLVTGFALLALRLARRWKACKIGRLGVSAT
jgi:hypothetical protein